MNIYDGQRMAEMLEADGMVAAAEPASADLVVLNGDYFSVTEESIKGLGSVRTMVGGRIVYNSGHVRVQDR